MTPVDVVALVLRLWAGAVMLAHGRHHLRSLDGTTRWFSKIGFGPARPLAVSSALGELAIGAGLIAGLATPFAAAGLASTMLIAFWTVHRFAGFYVFARPDEGYEYVGTLTVLSLVIAILGPGNVSVDAAIDAPWFWQGWPGVAAVAAGLFAGALLLAAAWRRPEDAS